MGERARRGLTHRQHATRELAAPCGQADGECAAFDRLVERGDDARTLEHPGRPGRARLRGGIGKAVRIHEHEPVEPHRQHRPRRGPDVPGVTGRDQDDAERREYGVHRAAVFAVGGVQ